MLLFTSLVSSVLLLWWLFLLVVRGEDLLKHNLGAPDKQIAQDLKEAVQEANVEIASHTNPVLPVKNSTWNSWLWKKADRLWHHTTAAIKNRFFRRRDRLAENITDEMARKDYELLRQRYIAIAQQRHQNDQIVNAIVSGNDNLLKETLQSNPIPIKKLHAYFEAASMMSNENALYMLIEEIDLKSSSHPQNLEKLSENDYVSFLSDLAALHLHSFLFERLFKAHPPPKPLMFLANIIESMIQAPPDIFLDYLSSCYSLSRKLRQPFRPLIERFYQQWRKSNRPLLNVSLSMIFLYLENSNADAYLTFSIELLDQLKFDPRAQIEGREVILRGFDMVLQVSSALERMTLGSQKWRRRIRETVAIALRYDPTLMIAAKVGLSTLFEAAWGVFNLADEAERQYSTSTRTIMAALDDLRRNQSSFAPLSFIAATIYTGFLSSRYFWLNRQSSLILLNRILDSLDAQLPATTSTLAPCVPPKNAQPITKLQLGPTLTDDIFAKLGYSDSKTIINAILAHTFRRPPATFHTNIPLAHLMVVDRLAAILTNYCQEYRPTVIFEL